MRYRKINNKDSVLRSPWASVFISSEKSKPCDFTFIFPRRTYFCDCLHAKSLYLKYSWLQSEPLPPKLHRKDKFRNLSTCMRTTMCSLKTLKPLILLGFQTFSIYSHSTNPIIWDCIFYVFTDKLFANLLMFHLLFLAAQFLSIKIVSQKAEKCNHIPRLFQITSHFSLILFFDMF